MPVSPIQTLFVVTTPRLCSPPYQFHTVNDLGFAFVEVLTISPDILFALGKPLPIRDFETSFLNNDPPPFLLYGHASNETREVYSSVRRFSVRSPAKKRHIEKVYLMTPCHPWLPTYKYLSARTVLVPRILPSLAEG